MFAPLLLALAGSLQNPTAPGPFGTVRTNGYPGTEAGWIPLVGVDTVVNDDIVTVGELTRASRALLERQPQPITTEEDLERFREVVRSEAVRQKLRSQAGAAEAPLEQLDQILDNHFQDLQERRGLVTYVEDLESQGTTADRLREEARADWYAQTWSERQVGLDDDEGQRPRRDRYVRPGEMHYRYTQSREAFARPATALVDMFRMVAKPGMSEDDFREACEAFRRRAEQGEPLQDLSREYGFAHSLVERQDWVIEDLAFPELRAFSRSAAPGEVSTVVVLEGAPSDRKELVFVRLVRRVDRDPPLPFVDGRVQDQVRRIWMFTRERRHLVQSELELIERSYISPPLAADLLRAGPDIAVPQERPVPTAVDVPDLLDAPEAEDAPEAPEGAAGAPDGADGAAESDADGGR